MLFHDTQRYPFRSEEHDHAARHSLRRTQPQLKTYELPTSTATQRVNYSSAQFIMMKFVAAGDDHL